MLTQDAKTEIAKFFRLFVTSELYGAGFGDAVEGCGACGADTFRGSDTTAAISLAYMVGYSKACQLANTYLSPRWNAAATMAMAGGILLADLQSTETVDAPAVARLCDQWAREIAHEAKRYEGSAA